ncbi:MAG TPA: hypothetical protein VFR10_14795 [bacterium]|nr:hypothetical protein [bacterium]
MQAEWMERRQSNPALDASWLRKLEGLAQWARENQVAIEAGSAELLCSRIAGQLGWSPIAAELAGEKSASEVDLSRSGIWILRVQPGRIANVAQAVEDLDGGEVSHPTLHLEESNVVHLPFLRALPRRWPGTESWIRAAHLLESPRRLRTVFIPRTFDDLVRHLATRRLHRATAVPPRERPRADVLLLAVDFLRAAVAWESKRDAYEIAAACGAHRCTWTAQRRDAAGAARDAEVVHELEEATLFSRLSGGGLIPLPHTVFAHDPRPAASRSLEARRS